MRFLKTALPTALMLCMGTASAVDYQFYASARFHGEVVNPDDTTTLDDYTGWRDAYSRIGFRANQGVSDGVDAYAQLELPLDIPNKAVQDPWDQEEDIRIAKVGAKGAFGDVSVGQMWMPYYNAIAYPVDMFSSYYSGFATYTTFRKGDTLAYYSPDLGGFTAAFGYSLENGASEGANDFDDRVQATLSYSFDSVTVSGGIDDLGGDADLSIWGLSASWQLSDALLLAAKLERHDSNISSGYGADGDTAANVYAGYTLGKNTFRAMWAEVENYGETVVHLGWDYQYRDDLKFFVEYYIEEETAAITTERGGFNETCFACSGGQVAALGLRYDFGAP